MQTGNNWNNGIEENSENSEEEKMKDLVSSQTNEIVSSLLWNPCIWKRNDSEELSQFLFLPHEIWESHICSHLSKKDLSNLRLVCQWMKRIILHKVWKTWVPLDLFLNSNRVVLKNAEQDLELIIFSSMDTLFGEDLFSSTSRLHFMIVHEIYGLYMRPKMRLDNDMSKLLPKTLKGKKKMKMISKNFDE